MNPSKRVKIITVSNDKTSSGPTNTGHPSFSFTESNPQLKPQLKPQPIRYITDEEFAQMVSAEEEYLKQKVAQGKSPLGVTYGIFTSHVHTDCDGRRYVHTYSF